MLATQSNALGAYSLPESRLEVQVYFARSGEVDGLIVAATTPRVASGETLPLSGIFSAASADKFTVDVDPATGFLKKISLNLEDKSQEIAKAAAATVGAIYSFNPGALFAEDQAAESELIASGSGPVPVRIATVTLDPSNAASVASANVELWTQVSGYLRWRASALCRGSNCGSPLLRQLALDDPMLDLGAAARSLAVTRPFIQTKGSMSANSISERCRTVKQPSAGVCVRMPRELSVGLQAPHGPVIWQGARLPVVGEEYLLNVERAMFATKTYSVEFEAGFAGKREVEQSSSALAIVSTPKVMIDAFIDSASKTTKALSELIPIRVEYRKLRHPSASSETKTTTTEETTADGSTTTTEETSASATTTDGASPPPVPEPPPTESDVDQADPPPTGPTMWFAACGYGLPCVDPLRSKLLDPPGDESPTGPVSDELSAPPADGGKVGGSPVAPTAPARPPGPPKPPPVKNPKL
jgi:hypothetical protein